MKRADLDVVAWYGGPAYYEPPPPTPPDDLHTHGPRAAAAPKDTATLAKVGVVLGRFTPVHVGHMHLVESAFARCGLLYVFTPLRHPYDASQLHVQMLKECFGTYAKVESRGLANPDPSVDARGHPQFVAWWAKTIRGTAENVTTLFSSDDGGGADALAKALGVEHVLIDPRRTTFPISASDIRADLYGRFRWVAHAARPLFALQVAVVGPEGAGKTTLVRELATLFQASVVEDSLRVEHERTGAIPAAPAFETSILSARGERVNAARSCTSGVVVSDDSAVLTHAWARRLGVTVSSAAATEAATEQVDVWLRCHNDFPFQGPPERDDPRGRRVLDELLEEALAVSTRKHRVVHVRGEGRDRVDVAADAVRAALEEKRAQLTGLLS